MVNEFLIFLGSFLRSTIIKVKTMKIFNSEVKYSQLLTTDIRRKYAVILFGFLYGFLPNYIQAQPIPIEIFAGDDYLQTNIVVAKSFTWKWAMC